jgi:hydrogenase expression/formation protein HypC
LEETWDAGGLTMGHVEQSEDAVCLAYVPEASAGDYVLVHLGFALEVLGPDVAAGAIAEREALADLERPLPP